MELIYYSKWGGMFNLTNNNYVWLTDVDGLTLSASDISAIIIGSVDGDKMTNIRTQPRPIILDLRIKRGVNVETAKRAIMQIVKMKQKCILQWKQNNRTWVIEGIVESVIMPRFNNEVTMQITIHCSMPFWEDQNETQAEISQFRNLQYFTDNIYDMLYFPSDGIPFGQYDTSRTQTFYNAGDVDIGMQIEILAYGQVTNPIIYDQNGNFFGVGYGSRSLIMNEGDKLIINTNSGQKNVFLNGVSQLDKIKPHSTWLQFEAGENEYSIDSDDEADDNMVFTLIYKQRYV